MFSAVLLVDDEATFLLRFRLVLQKVGINVQNLKHYSTVDEFVEGITGIETSDNVSFIDINLKGSKIDGLQLVKELRESYNMKNVIAIVSTSDLSSEITLAEKNGANAYIVKTGELSKFVSRMRKFKEDFLGDSPAKDFRLYDD